MSKYTMKRGHTLRAFNGAPLIPLECTCAEQEVTQLSTPALRRIFVALRTCRTRASICGSALDECGRSAHRPTTMHKIRTGNGHDTVYRKRVVFPVNHFPQYIKRSKQFTYKHTREDTCYASACMWCGHRTKHVSVCILLQMCKHATFAPSPIFF